MITNISSLYIHYCPVPSYIFQCRCMFFHGLKTWTGYSPKLLFNFVPKRKSFSSIPYNWSQKPLDDLLIVVHKWHCLLICYNCLYLTTVVWLSQNKVSSFLFVLYSRKIVEVWNFMFLESSIDITYKARRAN